MKAKLSICSLINYSPNNYHSLSPMKTSNILLGIDTGGTFTDFVLLGDGKLQVHKVLSTPAAPEQAILQGMKELGLMQPDTLSQLTIVHGSTVATNAALEGKGAKTVFITNKGFKDLLTIGRQTRRELYNLNPLPPEPPVPENLCLEIDTRCDSLGVELIPLRDEEIAKTIDQVAALQPESIAVCLLFSMLNPAAENRLLDALKQKWFVSVSSQVLAEYGEYERGIATWLNSYLGPKMSSYLNRLVTKVTPSKVFVMQSTGGTINAQQAAQRSVNLLLSGPAGGLLASQFLADQLSVTQLMTFDMGGTSTDVALMDGQFNLTNESSLGSFPIAVPTLDIHTIGAGGGSIAYLDGGGMLRVGPESAGADPGPACYNRGGVNPTVTDANLLLGKIPADISLGGGMPIDRSLSEIAIGALAKEMDIDPMDLAEGITTIANQHMTQALRKISVARGYDPKTYTLCCFGGAGGLHVCELAEQLSIHRAIVPLHGGVLSALGMLVAPQKREYSKGLQFIIDDLTDAKISAWLGELIDLATRDFLSGGVTDKLKHSCSVDLRYLGQTFTLNLALQQCDQLTAAFHRIHSARFGYQMDLPVEITAIRLSATAGEINVSLPAWPEGPEHAATGETSVHNIGVVPIYRRDKLVANQKIKGPAVITEKTACTMINEHWHGRVDNVGNLVLERKTS